MRCPKPVTVAGSITETLLHAPTAMLYHWNIVQIHNEQHYRELNLTPLLFTSYENYLRSSNIFQVSLNWIEIFGCLKSTKNWQFMFYEAVKKNMANSKETSFNNTISSTLSFITVLFEDLFESVNIQAVLVGEKVDPKHSIKSPKKTIHVMDMTLTLISSTMMSIIHSKKNRWCCLRFFASSVFGNSLKTSFVFWWK